MHNGKYQCHMAASNYHLLAAQQEPYKKKLTLNETYLRVFWRKKKKKSGEWTISRKMT